MERIKVSKNFFLDEFIPKEIYKANIHRPVVLFRLLNPAMIDAAQKLRDHHGPMTINNWWHGGARNNSGIRRPTCSKKYWSELSDHVTGNAFDAIFNNSSIDIVRADILVNFKKYGITQIENNVPWLHASVGWTNQDELYIFSK